MAEVRLSDGATGHRIWSEAQRAAVFEEMNRVLEHPAFKSSNRCVALLRRLVNHALDGDQEGLKERTIGIEVFGRSPDYDTNADPIVRRTANEIRKRLAQCYQEPELGHAVKIHLVRGSYLLEFDFEPRVHGGELIETQPPEAAPTFKRNLPGILRPETKRKLFRRLWIFGIAAALLVSAGWLLAIRFDAFRSPEYRVWKPLLGSSDWVMVCLSDADGQLASGTGQGGSQAINSIVASPQAPPVPGSQEVPPSIPFIDAHVSHAVTTRLLEFNRQTRLQPSSALTLQDFRQRPTVLIGGSNNPWALILLSKLRYSIRIDPATQDKWIEDAQNPTQRDWRIEGNLRNYSDVPYDYAVVTRFFDGETGQWIMALSGLEAYGTEAAGELVADPAFAKYIPANIRSTGNFQIVLRTTVLRGNTGPLQVLAVHTW